MPSDHRARLRSLIVRSLVVRLILFKIDAYFKNNRNFEHGGQRA